MNDKKYEIVKFIDDGLELSVSVSPNEETVWLSLEEMSSLFERDRSVIGKHIKKIHQEKELDEKRTRAKNARHINDGRIFQIDVYNLDVIIAVGYRVNSKRGTIFRQWANNVLKEYLIKGYAINENRTNVTEDNFNNLVVIVNNIYSNQITTNERLLKLEDKVFDKEYSLNKKLYNEQFYDAYTLIQQIFENAKDEIIIIDNYIDRTVLDRLM